MPPFQPNSRQIVHWTIAASSEAKRVLSGGAGKPVQVRLVNNGTAHVNIMWGGDGTVEATDTSLIVLAGVTEVLTILIPATGALFVAVKGTGATGTFEVTGGEGF